MRTIPRRLFGCLDGRVAITCRTTLIQETVTSGPRARLIVFPFWLSQCQSRGQPARSDDDGHRTTHRYSLCNADIQQSNLTIFQKLL